MNIARKVCTVSYQNVNRNIYRKFRTTVTKYESTSQSQPQVQEEKYDFEDLKVLERTERRKAEIPPFMKDVFVSIFNRDLLAYPEIINKEESDALDERIEALNRVFSDPNQTRDNRRNALKNIKMFSAPVGLTNGGLATNHTESLRYLETIAADLNLGKEISDHWVGLNALKLGLTEESYQKIIDDLTSGERPITLCIKEKVSVRIAQPDFKTTANLDENGIWRISGEKVCLHADGYFLVLCVVETSRLRMFLVHPGAEGVSHDGTYVTFRHTPSTPLDMVSEEQLSKTLGVSRLYTAALCRCSLMQAMQACSEYIRPRVVSGKPLAESPTIRSVFGEALLYIYASESAEYFTAGLLDGYMNPDAELEMAMCRNFIAHHGLETILKLLAIPNIEMRDESTKLLDDMRSLTLRGETMDSVNIFIALNGIHHAGKMMATEIKQIRNPLFHPTFILKKILADRHQESDNPKLNLFLLEHLHPTLKIPSEQLEYCVLRMRFTCETMMSRHGMEVANAHTELSRLSEAATEILVMTAVLGRASRAYCIGLRNAETEMKLAACFVDKSKDRVKRLLNQINDGEYLNLDHFTIQFGKKALDTQSLLVEKPTARVFW